MNSRISEQKKRDVTWQIEWEKCLPWNRIKKGERKHLKGIWDTKHSNMHINGVSEGEKRERV